MKTQLQSHLSGFWYALATKCCTEVTDLRKASPALPNIDASSHKFPCKFTRVTSQMLKGHLCLVATNHTGHVYITPYRQGDTQKEHLRHHRNSTVQTLLRHQIIGLHHSLILYTREIMDPVSVFPLPQTQPKCLSVEVQLNKL